jgi:hypothetical protein
MSQYKGQYSDNEAIDGIVSRLMTGEDHLSYSSLCAFLDSPRKFISYKLGRKEETPAMIYGAMLHCLVLEPAKFEDRYFAIDDTEICAQIGGAKPRATNQYRAWKGEQMIKAGDRKLVETSDYLHAKSIANDVLYNRASSKILEMAPTREKPVTWEYMNFKFKGYIDMDGQLTADLKSMPDSSPRKAEREIQSNFHFLQQAMYRIGKGERNDHYIIAVDKLGGVSVHELHKRLMEYGEELYQKIMIKFSECILKDHWDWNHDFWSERFDGIFTVDKPGWML